MNRKIAWAGGLVVSWIGMTGCGHSTHAGQAVVFGHTHSAPRPAVVHHRKADSPSVDHRPSNQPTVEVVIETPPAPPPAVVIRHDPCRYYPQHEVYYNTVSRNYFWLEAGSWRFGLSLPSRIVISRNDVCVDLELEATRPWHRHEEICRRYPRPVVSRTVVVHAPPPVIQRCVYYPRVEVYFNTVSRNYFWFEAGNWKCDRRLPRHIVIAEREPCAEIDLDGDKPWHRHTEIKTRHAFAAPPRRADVPASRRPQPEPVKPFPGRASEKPDFKPAPRGDHREHPRTERPEGRESRSDHSRDERKDRPMNPRESEKDPKPADRHDPKTPAKPEKDFRARPPIEPDRKDIPKSAPRPDFQPKNPEPRPSTKPSSEPAGPRNERRAEPPPSRASAVTPPRETARGNPRTESRSPETRPIPSPKPQARTEKAPRESDRRKNSSNKKDSRDEKEKSDRRR